MKAQITVGANRLDILVRHKGSSVNNSIKAAIDLALDCECVATSTYGSYGAEILYSAQIRLNHCDPPILDLRIKANALREFGFDIELLSDV